MEKLLVLHMQAWIRAYVAFEYTYYQACACRLKLVSFVNVFSVFFSVWCNQNWGNGVQNWPKKKFYSSKKRRQFCSFTQLIDVGPSMPLPIAGYRPLTSPSARLLTTAYWTSTTKYPPQPIADHHHHLLLSLFLWSTVTTTISSWISSLNCNHHWDFFFFFLRNNYNILLISQLESFPP